ncbi:hypothetical protein M9Y10_032037 [Tritrichomonas musculus]|uniref:START domain-containing protein n=1 Tax=Tritrichomonas musculus TaxID=1915356 RepID=A0ABR2H0I6_9EUKA
MATQEQVAEYEQKWQKTVDHVFSLIDAKDWKKEKSKDSDIEIFLRHDPSSSFAQIKSFCTINAPLSTVEAVLAKPPYTVDENTPKDQRDGNIERRFLGKAGDGADAAGFLYVVLETSSRLVSPREFLSFQKIAHKDGKVALVRTSIVNEALHGNTKGYVRGNIVFHAFIAEADGDNKTKLTFLGQADPCGSIPAMVYNAIASHQGYKVGSIKKEAEGSA